MESLRALANGSGGELKLLYLCPERLLRALTAEGDALGGILDALARAGLVSALVFDEAHCVVDWGTSFRKTYSKLGIFRERYPRIPIRCYTATAKPQATVQIMDSLGMQRAFIYHASINRPRLKLQCRPRLTNAATLCGMVGKIQITFRSNPRGLGTRLL